jgi:hypothetical protein
MTAKESVGKESVLGGEIEAERERGDHTGGTAIDTHRVT